MDLIGNIIDDFFDLPARERREGIYTFQEHERQCLEDIGEEGYYYQIRREPTIDHFGLIDILFPELSLREVFSTTQASTPTYVDVNLVEARHTRHHLH